MYKNKRKYIGIIVIIAVILTSTIALKIFTNSKIEEDPELLTARKYEQVEAGDEKVIGTDYVTFDAYYLRDLNGDGYAEKIRGTCKELGQTDTLYIDLNVLTNGTLKNGKITINGKNFYFKTALVKDNVLSADYIGENTKELVLNDIKSGTQKLMFGTIHSGYGSYKSRGRAIGVDTNNYSVTNNAITLTGTHVADDGTTTNINKTVTFANDWYGSLDAFIDNTNQDNNIANAIDEENNVVNITASIEPEDKRYQLLIAKNYVEAQVPLLNGYAPITVSVDGLNSEEAIYNSETRMLTINRVATKNESGILTSTVSREPVYKVRLQYPMEAYTDLGGDSISIKIPVKTYFEGFNNPGYEYQNPYVSNIAEDTITVNYKTYVSVESPSNVNVNIQNNISKAIPLDIYNDINRENIPNDTYKVNWYGYVSKNDLGSSLKLKETDNLTDIFANSEGNSTSIEKYVKNIGVYFSNSTGDTLGENGYINVYDDDNNELIHSFTYEDIAKYTYSNPYEFEDAISHIRVETSNTVTNGSIYITSIKQIDNILLTAEITREDFEKFVLVETYLTGYLLKDGTETIIGSKSGKASYSTPYSKADFNMSVNYLSNQETTKNVALRISTSSAQFNTKMWQNGVFLIKYPKPIINVEIVDIMPNKDIEIVAIDTYEENGNIFTKVYTSNENETDVNFSIYADITVDPKSTNTREKVELYSYNPICDNYSETSEDFYDLDNDGSLKDSIEYSYSDLEILAPSNLLTSQSAIDYDNKGSVTVAPKNVIIAKTNELRNATVNIDLTNNYSNTVSEIQIVGKIPAKGNTYQLNGADMGSNYDTTLVNGITIPEELKEYATIYYSYNDKVTNDITTKKNGWTTSPEDMSKVKSYMIDLGSYVMPITETKSFNYTIQIPETVDYNDIAYSSYAVYYCLDTEQGKVKTQTEPNKIGFLIAEKYNFEISNYQINTTNGIKNTIFAIQEVGQENSKSVVTSSTGVALVKELYVEKEYILKQISTTNNYVFNENEVRFIVHNIDDMLQIELLDGQFKEDAIIQEIENELPVIKATIENEIKYNFELYKTDIETNESIQGIIFELQELGGSVRRYTTDSNGKLTMKLLIPNKQYILKESDSQGHYLKDSVSFMMIRDENNNLKFNVLSGDFDTLPTLDATGEIPVVRTGLANEKIPTYSLRITKKEKDTDTIIPNAQFKLTGEDKPGNILYTTDENGIIQIDNLYEYVEGKSITGEYSLQEIYPTQGYVLNDEPVVFRALRDATNNLKFELISGNIREKIEDIQVDNTDPDNPVINITIDNEPVFTLTKVDAETKQPLEGVEFQITDTSGNLVTDSNGKAIGEKVLNLGSSGENGWSQNADGIWQSENYNMPNTTSSLKSENFTLNAKGNVIVEASVSSQTSDYLYARIINLDTNAIVSSQTIRGTTYGTEYNNLTYTEMKFTLEPGRYNVLMEYKKNASVDEGLDRGFVKSIKLNHGTIKTDSDGKIRLSLSEGLYRAIETKPLEGYEKPSLYTGIGIDASKPAVYSARMAGNLYNGQLNISDAIEVQDGFIAVSTNGYVLKYDFEGNVIWTNTDYPYDYRGVTLVEDGFIAAAYGGQIVKYDFSGKIIWRNTNYTYQYMDITTVNDGVVAVSYDAYVAKYNFKGELVWSKKESTSSLDSISYVFSVSDGFITSGAANSAKAKKYDFEGNFISYIGNSYTSSLIELEDRYILSHGRYIYNVNKSGEVISSKAMTGFYNETLNIDNINNILIFTGRANSIAITDMEGNNLWNNNSSLAVDCNNIVATSVKEDGFITIGNDGVVAKYDFEGNNLYKNVSINAITNIVDSISVADGFVVVTSKGIIAKYNLDNEIVWVNNEQSIYNTNNRFGFSSVAVLEDGYIVGGDKCILKFDLQGNFIWIKDDFTGDCDDVGVTKEGIYALEVYGVNNWNNLRKYDFEGNLIWSKRCTYRTNFNIVCLDNGIMVLDNKRVIELFSFDGTQLWIDTSEINSSSSFAFVDSALVEDGVIVASADGYIYKYDFKGNHVWTSEKGTATSSLAYRYSNITLTENGIIAYTSTTVDGFTVKYDLEGNIVWQIGNRALGMSEPQESLYIGNNKTLLMYRDSVKILEEYATEPEIPASQSVVVENELSKYNISTKRGTEGGNITGSAQDVLETVKYNKDSESVITVEPYEGYRISKITVNGNSIDYTENSDRTVTLPKFTQVKEDKIVTAYFTNIDKTLTISKTDSVEGKPLANATFNIKQLEDRPELNVNDIINSITANGPKYVTENLIVGEDASDMLGEMTNNNDTYYFIDNGNGGYESNNQAIASSTANSYMKIDLTNYTGEYQVVVNANVSSYLGDYGYVTVTNTETAPIYTSSSGRFVYITGTVAAKDYAYSTLLQGGNVYYLHFGYYKNASANSGEDKFTINSVKLNEARIDVITDTYNFVDNGNGGYESNNQGKANTVANSYIPIDLTNYKGKYTITVNANVSSQTYDYGYAAITKTTTAPEYTDTNGRLFSLSGTSSTAKSYSKAIDGGYMYYLHFGYYKNGSTDSGEDKLTINSINLTLSQSGFVDEDITTDSTGTATIQLEDGLYQITEVEAPEGYTLNPKQITHTMVAGQENKISVTNEPQVDLIVHHYLKDTTTSVAPDETFKGDLGANYTTVPKVDLERYQLVKNNDGTYQIPDNASGIYKEQTQVVTYYYELKPLQVIVHHKLYGTDDSLAEDNIIYGIEGEVYQTNPLDTLPDYYEIVTDAINGQVNGTFNELITEITYYYRLKGYDIITQVDGEGGTISGQNESVYEVVQYGKNNIKEVVITPNSGYQIKSIVINGIEQLLPRDKTKSYILPTIASVTESKDIIVTFEIQTMDYLVTQSWVDNSNELSKRPEEVEIKLYNGSILVGSKIISEENPRIIRAEKIEFSELSQTYPWEQNDDGTWQSGNHYVNSSTSVLTSDIFEVIEEKTLHFDWSVSSQGTSYDYLYYTITNVDTGAIIGGNTSNSKIGGSGFGTTYEKLKFNNVDINLQPGKYKIEFTYYKNATSHYYLDRGFVKNVYLGEDISVENSWEAIFEDVPMYDNAGNEMVYTAVLSEVNTNDLYLYDSTVEIVDYNSSTITSTFSIPDDTKDIIVTNNWIDDTNINGKRPVQVKLQLKNGDTILQEQVLDTASNDTQSYTFYGLKVYDDNVNEIPYTIDIVEINEGDLKFYSKEIDNTTYTITNTFTVPEDKVDITITTNWIDNDNINNVRPSQIKIQIMDGEDSVQDKIIDVTLENSQTYIFEDLPKYDKNGNEINYVVTQEDIIGYDNVIEGTIITNTIKSYNITVNEDPQGGTITEVTETITHGGSSTQDIIVTPNEGYQIGKITINGIEQELPEDKTQSHTLDKLTNVTEDIEIIVEFEKIPYIITVISTTENGTISESEEIVNHGEDSTKDIIIIPEEGFEIGSIIINGEELEFVPNDDGSYTLPKFTNVTEDKEVIVTFEYAITSVLVRYITEDGIDIVDSITIDGKVGQEYMTELKEFDIYELIEIPTNATGTMSKEQIVVTYTYRLAKGKLSVEIVDKNDNQVKLSGVVIKIEKLDKNGNIDTTFAAIEKTTDENGKVDFGDLLVGKYQITEIQAAQGYDLNKEATVIDISKNDNINLTFEKLQKLELPKTGEINYTIFICIIGVILMLSTLLFKKLRKS